MQEFQEVHQLFIIFLLLGVAVVVDTVLMAQVVVQVEAGVILLLVEQVQLGKDLLVAMVVFQLCHIEVVEAVGLLPLVL